MASNLHGCDSNKCKFGLIIYMFRELFQIGVEKLKSMFYKNCYTNKCFNEAFEKLRKPKK